MQVPIRRLEQLAAAFDAISRDTGGTYTAAEFVAFVRDELRAMGPAREIARELVQVGARRRWDRPVSGQ